MEKEDKMVLEASGEFPFQFFIEKAVASEVEDDFILEGIASTTNVDHDNERMSAEALRAMESAINNGGVPLRVEHSKEANAIIGNVFKAWVDDRNQLHIQARLDKSHPVSPILFSSMKQGAKMGLSVGGVVKRATREFVESTGKMIKTFFDVALNEVSVTPRPANYDSWLVAKSIKTEGEDGDRFRGTAFYNEFLFENPQLDYLQAFAKSVPDKAWHKVVTKNNSEHMTTEETEEKKKATEEHDTEKAVSRQEFNALVKAMGEGFKSVLSVLKMSESAADQDNPKEEKPKDVGDKSRKSIDEPAKDQNNPDEKKDDPEMKAKSETDGTDTEGAREKKKSATEEEKYGRKSEETETTKTSETADEKKARKGEDTTDEYDIEHITRSIKAIQKVGETMTETTEEKKKSSTEADEEKKTRKTEVETETTKGMQIDQFVAVVTKTLQQMAEKMEKSGTTVIGFQKSMIDAIREDPETQSALAEMLKQPGFKKSVSRGVPYVATKEGKLMALTMTDVGTPTFEKSKNMEGKTFKDVYQSEYSSIRQSEE